MVNDLTISTTYLGSVLLLERFCFWLALVWSQAIWKTGLDQNLVALSSEKVCSLLQECLPWLLFFWLPDYTWRLCVHKGFPRTKKMWGERWSRPLWCMHLHQGHLISQLFRGRTPFSEKARMSSHQYLCFKQLLANTKDLSKGGLCFVPLAKLNAQVSSPSFENWWNKCKLYTNVNFKSQLYSWDFHNPTNRK